MVSMQEILAFLNMLIIFLSVLSLTVYDGFLQVFLAIDFQLIEMLLITNPGFRAV